MNFFLFSFSPLADVYLALVLSTPEQQWFLFSWKFCFHIFGNNNNKKPHTVFLALISPIYHDSRADKLWLCYGYS